VPSEGSNFSTSNSHRMDSEYLTLWTLAWRMNYPCELRTALGQIVHDDWSLGSNFKITDKQGLDSASWSFLNGACTCRKPITNYTTEPNPKTTP